jgi:hypothetical protein
VERGRGVYVIAGVFLFLQCLGGLVQAGLKLLFTGWRQLLGLTPSSFISRKEMSLSMALLVYSESDWVQAYP